MKQGEGMENESRGWLLSACPFSVRRVSSRVHCVASLFPGREENMRGCVWAHEWAPALHGMLGVRAVKQRERRNKETKQNFQKRLVPWASACLSMFSFNTPSTPNLPHLHCDPCYIFFFLGNSALKMVDITTVPSSPLDITISL